MGWRVGQSHDGQNCHLNPIPVARGLSYSGSLSTSPASPKPYSDRDVITTPLKGPARPGNPTGMARGYAEPDYGRVDRQFVLSAVAGAAVVHALPSEWRTRALQAGLVIEAGFVARQLQLGVGFRF